MFAFRAKSHPFAGLLAAACALSLAACTSSGYNFSTVEYKIETVPSENANERVRFLVMHFTSSDFESSLQALTEPSSRPVSAHYLVPEGNDPSYPHRDLRVYQLVDENWRAWHAGASRWENRIDLNDQSIGIEIVNKSRCFPPVEVSPETASEETCIFPDYDPRQIELLIALAKDILKRYPEITPTRVIGHGDIAPQRKIDPGPRFLWEKLAQAGIGAWYENAVVQRNLEYLREHSFGDREDIRQRFAQWLADYGYGIDPKVVDDKELGLYIRAFQYHFRPWKVDGEADLQSCAILLALLEKYFPHKLDSYQEINASGLAELNSNLQK